MRNLQASIQKHSFCALGKRGVLEKLASNFLRESLSAIIHLGHTTSPFRIILLSNTEAQRTSPPPPPSHVSEELLVGVLGHVPESSTMH